MNSTTTRWLLLVVVLVGAFILTFERRAEDTQQRANRAARLLPELAVNAVTSLSVLRGTNLALRFERVPDGWEFRAPIRYTAQPAAVDRLLTALAQLRWQAHLTVQDLLAQTNGMGAFGLDPPPVVVAVQQGERRMELRLGSPTVLGGQIYAQVVGREGLYTVEAGVLKALPSTLNDWRDTALVRLSGLPFDRLSVRPITNGFELVRSGTNRAWQMVKPLPTPTRADNGKLTLLLQQLELLRVSQFVADDPRADLEAFGLQPPERELVFGQGTNDVLVLQVGKSPTNAPDQVFVRRLANSNVVQVAGAVLAPWLAGFREFCDPRMMVFKAEAVSRIEGRAAEAFALERGTNNTWRIVEPFRAPADPVLVLEMLQNLAELEFEKFEREVAAEFAPYGLAPPRRQYVLKSTLTDPVAGPTNQVIAQVDLGNPTGARFFARRSLENSVVIVLDNNRLPTAGYELRDRRIWNVTTNQMTSITVQQLGATRRLLRTGPMQWAPAPGSDGPVNSVSLEEAAYRLGQLRADRWVARGEDELPRYGFGTIDHRVTLEAREGDKTATYMIRFGRQLPSGRSVYAAVTIEGVTGPVIFECPRFIFDFVQSDLTALPPRAGGSP